MGGRRTGCTRISAGCAHCYAERMAKRLKAMGQANYARGFEVTLHEHALELPLRLTTPQRIFVNSMSDLLLQAVGRRPQQARWGREGVAGEDVG